MLTHCSALAYVFPQPFPCSLVIHPEGGQIAGSMGTIDLPGNIADYTQVSELFDLGLAKRRHREPWTSAQIVSTGIKSQCRVVVQRHSRLWTAESFFGILDALK